MIVQAPDNKTIDFGDMPQDKVAAAMQKLYPKKEETSFGGDVAKSAGSGLAQGAVGLVTGPVDIGAKIGNWAANKVMGGNAESPPSLTNMATEALGVDYAAKTIPGQYASTIGSFVPAFAALSEGNPTALMKSVGKAAASGTASESAGQLTKGTSAEPLARLAGGFVPGGISSLFSSGLKGILRGGASPQKIESNINAFNKAGIQPSVGQATESNAARSSESFLSKVPGSAGQMREFAYKQGQDLGKNLDKMASELAPSSSGEAAGRAIEKGITESYLPRARLVQNALYDRLDQYIPGKTLVGAENTTKLLDEITAPIPQAKSLSETKLLSNPILNEVKSALKKDMGGMPGTPAKPSAILQEGGQPFMSKEIPGIPGRATMPYESLKELRSRIGRKLETVDLAPDIPKAELKRLYGALSEDMKAAARQSGPQAEVTYNKANSYTKSFHEKIDQMQSVIDKKDPEKIFRAAMSGTAEGATTLRTIMKSLPPDARGMLSAAVIRRLGRATPGNQNDIGSVFSAGTFLTNWNKLSPQAKSTLFDGYGAKFSNDMDRIAKVANNIKEGSKVYQNASGTAPAEELIKTGTGLGTALVALFTGHPMGMAAVGGGMTTANMGARLFTNPKFVSWLADTTDKPMSYAPKAMANLNKIAIQTGQEDEGNPDQDSLKNMMPHPPSWGLDNVLHQQGQQ